MAVLPNVAQYTKNLIKSTVYASGEMFGEMMPGMTDFKDANKEVLKSVYVAVRDYRKTFQRVKEAIVKSKVYEAADVALKNLKSDLATGDWYNHGRQSSFEANAIMGGIENSEFNIDESSLDTSFDESALDKMMDFGESEFSEEEMNISEGDAVIAKTVKDAAGSLGDVQVRGIDAMLKSNRAAANFAYVQGEKLMKVTQEGFDALNQTASSILQFNTEGMQKHFDNSAAYFTETQKLAQERNAMLKELVEMQRNIYKMYQTEDKKQGGEKKYTFNTIASSSGMVSLEEYGGNVLANIKRALDDAGMGMINAMGSMAGENPLLSFAQNPLGDIVKILIGTALGPAVQNAAKALDSTASGIFGTFVSKMNKMGEEDGPLGLLGKILGVRDTVNTSLSPEQYKRGAMPWDGESKKALTEVIPHYLANIEAALTGRHQLFDYQTGRYVDSAAIRSQFEDMTKRYRYKPFSDLDQIMRYYFSSQANVDPAEQRRLAEDYTRMKEYWSASKGRFAETFQFNEGEFKSENEKLEDLAMEIGVDPENLRGIIKYLKQSTSTGDKTNPLLKMSSRRGVLMNVSGKIMQAREDQNREMQSLQDNNSIMMNLFNGGYMQSRDRYGILRNNMTLQDRLHIKNQKDDKGNNIFYYLQNIYKTLVAIKVEGFNIGTYKPYEQEETYKKQKRKLSRGVPPPKPPAQPTSDDIKTILSHYDSAISEEHIKETWSEDRKRREAQDREDQRYKERMEKYANERKQKGIKYKGPELIGYDDPDNPDTDKDAQRILEMSRLFEKTMILNAKQAQAREDDERTWLGKQWKEFKEGSKKDDKDVREEINKKGFLDALIEAGSIGDKWNTIRVGLQDLSEKPSTFITTIFEEADEKLYKFFFEEEEIEDKRNGKKYKGFFGRLRANMDNLFVEMNEGLNKYLFEPLKDKLGVEGPWDAVKKGLNYVGIDIDAIGKNMMESMSTNGKAVWGNIKESFKSFFQDAIDSIEEDERKMRELEDKDKTVTGTIAETLGIRESTPSTETPKEETASKKSRFSILDDHFADIHDKARALNISDQDISKLSERDLRMEVIRRSNQLEKQRKSPHSIHREGLEESIADFGLVSSVEDRDKFMDLNLSLVNATTDLSTKKQAYDRILSTFEDHTKDLSKIDKDIAQAQAHIKAAESDKKTYEDIKATGALDPRNQQDLDMIDTFIKDQREHLKNLKQQRTALESTHIDAARREEIAKQREAIDALIQEQDKASKIKEASATIDVASMDLYSSYSGDRESARIDVSQAGDLINELTGKKNKKKGLKSIQRKNDKGEMVSDARATARMKKIAATRARNDFEKGDYDLFYQLNEDDHALMEAFIDANPGYVFDLHAKHIAAWITETLGLRNKEAIWHILNKMRADFVQHKDLDKVFSFKFLKGITDQITADYDAKNFSNIASKRDEDGNVINSDRGVRIGSAVKESFISDRLATFKPDDDIRMFLNDRHVVDPDEAGDASRGITGLGNQLEAFYGDNKIGDLFNDLKTAIDENLRGTTSTIAFARDAITKAIENLNAPGSTIVTKLQSIEDVLQNIKTQLTTGTRAEGRGSLELAPAETAVVSKGEIIKPIVGPSEKITKTGLYNLGRGDAVIPNPSEATRDRNKIEESNKLSQISKDLSTGKSISQHMASSTKMFAEGRDFFDDVLDRVTDMIDVKTGEEAANDDEKDDLWSVKLGSFATGRPTIKLDTPKEEAAYTQSVADSMYQDFIKDMPKYAEGKKSVTSKDDVLAFVNKHKDKIKSKNIDDPKFIQELSELIKNESDDNKWKQNKKTTSSVSEMLGYLVDSTKGIIGANAKDTDLIQTQDGSSTLVSDLKESVEAMRQTRMSVSKDEIVNGVQTSVIGKAIGDGINNFKGGLMDVLAGLTGIDSKQVKEATAKTYEEVKQHIPNVIAKGTLGLVGGTILGGPLVGAMLGAGLGVVESSETFRTALFGTAIKDKEGNIVGRKDDGLIDKEVIDAYKKYSPAMKGYGLLGTIAGLITPFGPLGGALIGAGIGAITRTDEFQDAFFGKKGIFDKDTRDFIKKAAPNAAAAAVGMAFLGPFGLVGNLMLGGATGFMASTEQFKTALFGAADSDGKRTGGIVGAIKQSIVDPWLDFGKKVKDDLFAWVKEDVFAPLKGAIAPIGKQIQLAITGMVKGLGQIISHWTEVILGKPVVKFLQKWIMEPASKFFRGAVDFALKPVKAVLSAPSKIIGGIGNMLKRRQIQMGNADYMTAAERLKFREDKGMRMDDQWTAFDTAISTSSTDNLATLLDTTKIMQSGDKELKAHKDKQVKKLWATIDSTLKRNGENAISDDQKVKLEKLLMSDNKEDRIEANHLLEEYMSNLKIPEKEKGKVSSAIAKTTEDLDYKKQSLENFRTYGMDMVAKEFKEQLGVDLDTTNIGKFTDMLEKELSTRKKEDEATTTDAEDAINDSIRDQTSVLSAHLVDIKKVLEAMVEGNGIITSDQVHRIRDLNAGMKESAQYHREKAGYDTLEARKKLTSVFGKDRVDFIEDFDKLFTSIDKDGTTILDTLLDMGSKGYSPDSLNTMLNANDKQRERLITMFNKVGLQTGDLKALEGLTDQEFQNILTARAMGLDISDMSEAKDLTSREVEDMLYIRNTTGLSNKELNNAVLKRLVRSGKGAVLRQLPKEDLETFIDPVTKANLSDKRVKGNLYASGQVNMAAPKVSDPNTIANSFLNFMSTSGTIPMGLANAFLRNWSHNPKRKFEGVTSLDDVMHRFAGAEATRDVLAGQGFTSLERSMDPEAKQANAEAMQGINALVAKYQEQGIPDAEIEKTLDVKIRRTEDGGYKVTDNQRIKYDNDEIKGLSNEYSYDAFNKFLSMLMSTPGMQEEMARQLMSGTNATLQDLAGGIQQGIVRTAPAATKRQSIEDIFSNFNFNKKDIDDFKHGISTDDTEKMLQVLLDKGITEDEIQKYRSYAEGRLGIIRGYASGGGPSTMTRLRRRYRHTRDRMKSKWENLDPTMREFIKDQTVGEIKNQAIEQVADTLGISPEQLPEDHPIRQIQEYTDPGNLVIKGVEQISPETAETMKEIKETNVIDLIKDSDAVQSASDAVSSTMDSVISGISHSFSMLADMIQKIPDTIQSVTHTLQTMPVDQMVAQLDPNMIQSALKVVGFAEGRSNVIEPGSMVDGYGINIKDIVSNVEANKNLELSNLVSGDTTFGYEEEEPEVKVQPITIINQAPVPIPSLPEEAKEVVTLDPKDVIPELESEKNLRMLVSGVVSKFYKYGFYPDEEAIDKLDYTKGMKGLFDSGYSLSNLYGPKVASSAKYVYKGENDEDVIIDASFYENMEREEQVALAQDLLRQTADSAFKNGIITLPTPDGPKKVKIADLEQAKSLVPNKPTVSDVVERSTEYGIIKGTTTTDGSIRPADKDSKEIVGKIELDHTSRVHTAGVLDEIKDLLVDFLGGNKPKKEQEKRSFWDMLKDLLMLLAAFLLSGGLSSLIEGGISNLANVLGQIIKNGIKEFRKALIEEIDRIGNKIDKAIEKLKVKLSIKKPTMPKGPKGRGFAEVMKRDAELLAARMKGFENPNGYKEGGKAWKDTKITDEARAEYEKLKAKSEVSLTEAEKAHMTEIEKMIEREAEINQHLAKIREGGLGAMSTEELDKFTQHFEAHPELEARATLFDEMHKAKLEEMKKYPDKFYQQMLEEHTNEIREKSARRVKWLGASALTDTEREILANRFANMGMGRDQILEIMESMKKDKGLIGAPVERIQAIPGAAKDAIKTVTETVSKEFKEATTAMKEGFHTATEPIRTLGDTIGEKFDKAVQPIKDLGSSIKEKLGNISEGITDTARDVGDRMVNGMSAADEASVREYLTKQGFSEAEIESKIQEINASRRTVLGRAIDVGRDLASGQADLNMGETGRAAAEEGGILSRLGNITGEGVAKAAAIGSVGAGALYKLAKSPFEAASKLGNVADQALTKRFGMAWKVGGFVPKLILGAPGFAVDSIKATAATGKAIVKGGLSTGFAEMAQASRMGALKAMEEGSVATSRMGKAAEKIGEGAMKVGDTIYSILAKILKPITSALSKLTAVLPGGIGQRLSKGFARFSETFAQDLTKVVSNGKAFKVAGGGARMLMGILGKVCLWYTAFELTKAVYNGFANPGVILHIKNQAEVSNGVRVVAAVANAISVALLELVEPKTIADLVIKHLGPIVGFGEKEQKMAEESEAEFLQWKQQEGNADKSFEDFLKDSGTYNDNGILTNIANFTSELPGFVWERVKDIFSGLAQIPPFIFGKISELGKGIFNIGESIQNISQYWNKLSDRSATIAKAWGKLSPEELEALNKTVEIDPNDPLFGIKSTMKDFASQHWFIMSTVGWAIGKVGEAVGSVVGGIGNVVLGIKDGLSGIYAGVIEGDPTKIMDTMSGMAETNESSGIGGFLGRAITGPIAIPAFFVSTGVLVVKKIGDAIDSISNSFDKLDSAFSYTDTLLPLALNGDLKGLMNTNPFRFSTANNNGTYTPGDTLAGIVVDLSKLPLIPVATFNLVANNLGKFFQDAITSLTGRKFDMSFYDGYKLKSLIDKDYIDHNECPFDPKAPLATGIPSALETIYKLFSYPSKAIGYVFEKISTGPSFISDFVKKIKNFFGSLDDIDKQNKDIGKQPKPKPKEEKKEDKPKAESSADTLAPSTKVQAPTVGADQPLAAPGLEAYKKKIEEVEASLSDDEKKIYDDTLKNLPAMSKVRAGNLKRAYEKDQDVKKLLDTFRSDSNMTEYRDAAKKALKDKGLSPNDEVIEIMLVNLATGKNVFGKGVNLEGYSGPEYNKIDAANDTLPVQRAKLKAQREYMIQNRYQQNAPGNEKIRYNIPGDTKVDTVAARSCAQFSMGAAKDYLSKTPTNMAKELSLGKKYLAKDDGTKFDYFKDSGSRSGYKVTQTSDMATVDKATSDPNKAVVSMVDTGQGMHYQTYTDKITKGGKQYYKTTDPEKPVQTLTPVDVANRQQKMSFVIQRGSKLTEMRRRAFMPMLYGRGNTMSVEPQSGPTCTIHSTKNILRAYTGKEPDFDADDQSYFGSWYSMLKSDLNIEEKGFSKDQRSEFEAAVKAHFDAKPNNPILLYQTGGDGSGNDPLIMTNRCSGNHATVLGRKLSDGTYEDYDSNGGIVHKLKLNEIFDPSAQGSSRNGTSYADANLLMIPTIEPSSPIDHWVGGSGESAKPDESNDNPEESRVSGETNTNNNKGLVDQMVDKSPIAAISKLYNILFSGGETGSVDIGNVFKSTNTADASKPSTDKEPTGVVADGYIPKYKQFDPQWEGEKWPNFTNSGCAPTSVAIQAEGVTGKVHTPKTVSEWAVDNGLRDNKPGLITGYAKNAGYEVEAIDYATKETGKPALKAMEAGKPVIIGLEAGALGGLGGSSGHYLVGQAIKDGKILINNPGRNNEPGNEGFEAVHTWDELIATKPDLYVPKDNELGKGTSDAAAKSIMDSTVATLSEEDKNKVLSAFSNSPYYQTLESDASVIHSRIGFDSDTAPGYLRSKVKRVFAAKEALEREAHKYARVIPGEPYKKTYKHTKPAPLDLYKKTGYGRGYYEDWGMWKGPDIDKRAEYVWNYLKNLGLSDVAAAGVMGNWRVEDPPLEPKFGQDEWDREIPTLEAFVEETGLGAAGYGIAQWTYPTRQEDLMKYAKAQGLSSGDLDAQLGYANQEAGQGVWDEVNQDTDPADSAEHFMRIYEKPGEPHLDRRRDEAVQAYNNFSGKTFKVDTPPKSDTPSASIAPSNSDNGITKAAKSSMSLIDKYLLPALDEAIKQSGYYELLKKQYGIDVQSMTQLSNVVSGGNITATVDGEPANTPNANAATTPAEPANTPNAGAASGESVGQAMINYGPEGTILTSLFGPRTLNGAPDFHNGVDIGYDEGTPVYSPITATVDGADYEGGYGNYVVLKDDAGKYYMFAHLSQHSVKTGQTVKPGDQLGLSGNTGHSFGAHLHFGVHDDAGCLKNPDTSHNPMEYPLGKGTLASDVTKNANIDSLSDFTKGLSSITTEDIDSMAKMQYGKGMEDFTPYTINDRAIPTGMLMDNLLDFANDTIPVQRSKILAQYEFMRTHTAPKHVEDFKPYTINDTNIPEGMLRDNLLDPNNDTIAVQRAKILAQYEFMRDNGLLGKGTHFEPYTIHDRNIPEGMLRDNLIDYENDTNPVQRAKILAQYKFMKENSLLDTKNPSIPDNKIDTAKTQKDFKPYTINDTDIPEGMLRDNLIDPINDTISVQREKTRVQYEFMRDHNLLPTEEAPTDVAEPTKTPSAEAHTPIVDMKAFKKTHEALLKRRMEQITGRKPSMLEEARKEDLAKLGIDPTKTTPTVPTDKKKKPSFLEKLLRIFTGEGSIWDLFDDKDKKPSMLEEASKEDLAKLGIDPLKTTPPTDEKKPSMLDEARKEDLTKLGIDPTKTTPTVPTDEKKKPSMLDEARKEDLTKLGIDPLKTTPPTVPTDKKKKPSFLDKLLGLFTGEGSILNSGIFDDKGKFDKHKLRDALPSILGTLFGKDTAPEEEDTVTPRPKTEEPTVPRIEEAPKKEENPLEGIVKLVDPFQVKNIVEGDKVSYDGLEDIFKTKQQPTEEPKGFDLGSIFGGESGGLGSIFSGKGFDLGGLFGGESGGKGFNLGNLFGGGLFDDKGKFNKGSIPGLVGGLINTFGLFGEHSEEYKAKKKAEKEAKERTELEDKPVIDEAKRYEDFKPYTINDKDIPEGMLKDNLIDYDNDTISVQRDKKQAQYNFMKENNLLPDTKTPDVPTPDNKVETAKVPEDIKNKAKGFMDKFSKDLAEATKKEDTKKPTVETPKEEEAKPTPPAAPKVEEKEETPEERERKAKEQIVQGTGDHMHLEATVGEKQPAISDSKIDQLLAVLGVIAENTTKLVQLASSGSDTGSNTTINASRTNISAPPKDFNPQSIQGVLSWMGQIIRR